MKMELKNDGDGFSDGDGDEADCEHFIERPPINSL